MWLEYLKIQISNIIEGLIKSVMYHVTQSLRHIQKIVNQSPLLVSPKRFLKLSDR